MAKDWSVIIVDDHSLFRDGLKYILSQTDNIKIVGEAGSGREFMELIKTVSPDVVLMDISMPGMNGIEATEAALKKYPDLKIITLTMFEDETYYYEMLKAGAKGFVLKEAGSEELIDAINQVAEGNSYYPGNVIRKFFRSYPNFNPDHLEEKRKDVKFSERELLLLKMISLGLSNREVSEKMGLSLRTVESIRAGLLNKTGSANSLNLVLYAFEHNLL